MKRDQASLPLADGWAFPGGLAALYRSWRQPLVRLLQGRFGSRADAEDAAQQVFARMAASGSLPRAGGRAVTRPLPRGVTAEQLVDLHEAAADWRSGHVRLQRMPLAEVAQELARYLGRPVRLDSQELASLPVSGDLATAAPEGFLELLPDLVPVPVPVRVRREAGGWVIARR